MDHSTRSISESFREDEAVEIDLLDLLGVVWKNITVILLAAAAGAILAYLLTVLFITPTYDSTTKIYVLNKQDSSNATVTYSDLQSSTQLTKDYMELVTTRPVLEEVISSLHLDMTYEELEENISTSTATDGRIISITATADDPQLAKDIADGVRDAVSAQIVKVMAVEAVNVAEEGNLPTHKARPSNLKNAVIGAMLGFLIALAVVTVNYLMDDRIKTEEDVERYLGLSTLAVIPMDEQQKKNSMKKKSMKKKSGKHSAGTSARNHRRTS